LAPEPVEQPQAMEDFEPADEPELIYIEEDVVS
jgi:hypothetical protein